MVVAVAVIVPGTRKPHRLEHVLRVVAAGAVGREPHSGATPQHLVEAHAAAAELSVAGRIVDRNGALAGDPLDVALRQPNAVSHRQAFIEKTNFIEMGHRHWFRTIYGPG